MVGKLVAEAIGTFFLVFTVGQTVMNPGSAWFSVPRPYVIHEPRLGLISRASPQFMRSSDGS